MNAKGKCNMSIRRILELTYELESLADDGDAQREDVGCGILFGTVRDYAYKLRSMAQSEIDQHKKNGKWNNLEDKKNNHPAVSGER